MNILFLGGGRRVLLAKRFVERGHRIFSYELVENVPISSVATVIKGLPWKDESIVWDIMSEMETYKIDLVIPLMDGGVKVCSLLPKKKTVCSSRETAELCFDKRALEVFIMNHFPDVYPSFSMDPPLIAKPRFGFGSQNLVIMNTKYDLSNFLIKHDHEDYVIQRKIIGKEYSVDSYFDKNGTWVDSVPRERIRIGSGEVITSKTTKDNRLITWTKVIGERLGVVGPSNTQFIIEEITDKVYFIEVNARFGGGFTLSMQAGLDAISLIERDYFGREFDYTSGVWEEGLLMERSYEDHYFSS